MNIFLFLINKLMASLVNRLLFMTKVIVLKLSFTQKRITVTRDFSHMEHNLLNLTHF